MNCVFFSLFAYNKCFMLSSATMEVKNKSTWKIEQKLLIEIEVTKK